MTITLMRIVILSITKYHKRRKKESTFLRLFVYLISSFIQLQNIFEVVFIQLCNIFWMSYSHL